MRLAVAMLALSAATAFRAAPARLVGLRTAAAGRLPRASASASAASSRSRRALSMAGGDPAAPKTVLVPIATGSEEIETTCIVDTLVRAGADVTVASVEDDLVCVMSRGVKIMADVGIDDVASSSFDLVVCPGGMPGAERLRDCAPLTALLQRQAGAGAEGKYVAAVCAAPAVVLQAHGILEGKRATCYPAPPFVSALANHQSGAEDDVVVDGNVVTSRGPGTSLKFALKLVEVLYGAEKSEELHKQMLVPM